MLRGVKKCPKCGQTKALTEFHRDKNKRLGVRSRCKDCGREPSRQAARQWYAENAAQANAKDRQERLDNPEKIRQRDREWYANRSEAQKQADREWRRGWREKRRDELAEYKRQWAKANPEKRRQYQRNASPEAKARHAAYLRDRKKAQHEWVKEYREECGCVDCGKREGRLEFDHRPGEDKRFNVTQGLGYSWEVLLAEIAKCDVRCGRCHRQRHGPERRGIPKPRKKTSALLRQSD